MTVTITSEEEAEEYESAPDDEEEIAEMWREIRRSVEGDDEGGDGDEGVEKADKSPFEQVDDALMNAMRKSAWWEQRFYQNDTELSKAPRIWEASEEVPEVVRDLLEEVIDTTEWDWATFDNLTPSEADRLEELLEERMTQPQGWSLESLTDDIQREFGLEETVAAGMAGDTTHSVLNEAKEEAYERMEGSESFEFDWVNPMDSRTTPVCRETIEEINDRGGSVSKSTLKQILRRKAIKYEGSSEGGGTPQTVEEWKPHYGCRSALVRRVQSI